MMDNIDATFKKAMQKASVEPPAYLWENIQKELLRKRKRKTLFAWWTGAAACAVVALCFFSLTEYKNFSPESGPANRWQVVLPGTTGLNSETAVILSARAEIPLTELPVQKTKRPDLCKPAEISNSFPYKANTPSLPYLSLQTPAIRTDYIPLINKQAYKTQDLYQKILLEGTAPKNEKNSKKPAFAISGHFAPGYADGKYTVSGENTSRTAYNSPLPEGIFNMSGGMKFSVRTGKKFVFQLGLLYTRMGQKSRGGGNRIPKLQLMSAPAPANYTHFIPAPLGKIKSASATNTVYYAVNSVSAGSSDIEQLFGAVEIPLAVKYRINDNKLKFSVSAGFSGSFIVSNKAYLTQGNDREYIGTTEDIRTFNLSADWALGMEYPVSPRISVLLEPGFRYYLQSISKNKNIDFKPYIFSLSTGIGINF